MSYVVLARKWRPRSFDELVGQEHVSRTLSNAIEGDRVAHAFLFTGVRGVGKTTTARILAKALNCQEGPTPTPCQKCPACCEIPEGDDVDVQEIDGASYNGVDEVRRLQESLPYRPARDRFKIYIVDEVHMLSTAAWNAFLKTLEEPPPHVKFIFATTEVHKVPQTILSRCQRYDFKLIGTSEIAAQITAVLKAEKVKADAEAARLIAREAAGSMRDAMSLLDQVIAWVAGSKERLTGESVGRVLGVAAHSILQRLAVAVIGGDAAACLDIVSELAGQGFSMTNVAKDFLSLLRDVVVAKVSSNPEALLERADSELSEVVALAEQSDLDDLSRVHLAFSKAFDDISRSGQPRAALEMSLVRIARRPPLAPLDDLLHRISELERRLSGPAGDEPSGGSSRGAGGGGRRPPSGQGTRRRAGREAAAGPRAGACGVSAGDLSLVPPDERALGAWRDVLAAVAEEHPAVASVFEHAAPLHVAPGRIVLGMSPGAFVAKQAQNPEALALVRTAASGYFGCETPIELDWSGQHEGVTTVATLSAQERAARLEEARRRVAERPLVKAALEEFGVQLRDIRLPDDTVH